MSIPTNYLDLYAGPIDIRDKMELFVNEIQ